MLKIWKILLHLVFSLAHYLIVKFGGYIERLFLTVPKKTFACLAGLDSGGACWEWIPGLHVEGAGPLCLGWGLQTLFSVKRLKKYTKVDDYGGADCPGQALSNILP